MKSELYEIYLYYGERTPRNIYIMQNVCIMTSELYEICIHYEERIIGILSLFYEQRTNYSC